MPGSCRIHGVNETTDQDRARRRLFTIGGIVLAAIAVVALVIVLAGSDDTTVKSTTTTGPTPAAESEVTADTSGLDGVKEVTAEFADIPQTGNTLGSPGAPATMMVFADMQCPFCAEFENSAMPALITRYVRPGKLKIVFQPIVILGNDSELGARAVAAAAQQNKAFEYAAILYRNQGQENTGYLDNAYVEKIASATPGLDTKKLTGALRSAPVEKLLADAQSVATSGKVDSTPSFFISKTGEPLQELHVSELTAEAFTPKLDALTR